MLAGLLNIIARATKEGANSVALLCIHYVLEGHAVFLYRPVLPEAIPPYAYLEV